MNFDNIGEAILIAFDELQNDEQSSDIIDAIDGGESDSEIKEGLQKAILRLRELGKDDIAKKIENNIKDW